MTAPPNNPESFGPNQAPKGVPPGNEPPSQPVPPGYGPPAGQGVPPGHAAPVGHQSAPVGGMTPPPTWTGAAPPEPPKRRRRGILVAAACVVALVLAGGGAFAFFKLRGSGGAASPEDAVVSFLNAAATLDVTKTAATLAPSERAWISVTDLAPNLPTLDKIASNDQADQLSQSLVKARDSIKIEFKDVKVESEELVPTVQRSVVTGGSISVECTDPDALAQAALDFAASVSELANYLNPSNGFDEFDFEAPSGALGDNVPSKDEIVAAINDNLPYQGPVAQVLSAAGIDEFFLVTVEEDGQWFTSMSMTAAQYVWEAAGMDNADLGQVVPADKMVKYSNPEDAVKGYYEALLTFAEDLDATEFARHLAPAESRLLAVYGQPLLSTSADGMPPGTIMLDELEVKQLDSTSQVARVGIESLKLAISTGNSRIWAKVNQDGSKWIMDIEAEGTGHYSITWDAKDAKSAELKLDAEADGDEISFTAEVSLGGDGSFEGSFEANMTTYWGDPETVSGSISIKDDEVTYDLDDPRSEPRQGSLTVPGLSSSLALLPALPTPQTLTSTTALKASDGWHVSIVGSLIGAVLPPKG
ncbi:MAG: hypothetical protein FWD29_08070 [Micrococcales bacterium]|nr:hypothetical protein [Micrococcales bacterium]